MDEPQAAASVMIGRETSAGIEFFMLRRSSRSAFMPSVFVFPGGRVEAPDRADAATRQLAGALPGPDKAFVYAAARETFEECGLLFATRMIDERTLEIARSRVLSGTHTFAEVLADLGACIDGSALRYFSRWITPPFETRRFDTRFFVARAPAGQAAQADAGETHDGLWITPVQALARNAGGTFALIYPTIKHLERVAEFVTLDALLDYAAHKPIHAVMPTVAADRTITIPAALEGVW
ncbi:MAG: NUDIX hydrolase [Candidatus Velthaea sp.]|jgi:8-oxo-dGTP pyrophosphatase MutT (NUDIX family)